MAELKKTPEELEELRQRMLGQLRDGEVRSRDPDGGPTTNMLLQSAHELAIIAARISPPAYVKAELGERPSDPTKRKAWDRGVAGIERYRQEHGVKDPNKAFGREAKRGAERARQEATRRRLQEVQRALGLGQHAARARQLGKGLSIGR